MATASSPAPCKRSRRRFFQISLRTLMLLFVLCPVAAWYWQRPYEVEVVSQQTPPGLQAGVYTPASSSENPHYRREVRTVRRGWSRGHLVRHGPTTTYDGQGNKLQHEFWRAGVLHGPYREWSARGQLLVEGHFVDGERQGAWNEWDTGGRRVVEEQYEKGLRSGKCIYHNFGEECEYKAGKLVQRITDHWMGDHPAVRIYNYDEHPQVQQMFTRSLDRSLEWERVTLETAQNPGKFVASQRNGVKSVEGTWRHGQREGIWRFWDEFGDVRATLKFEFGALVHWEGDPSGHYPRSFRQDSRAAVTIANAFQEVTELEFIETPLAELVAYVQDRHNIPVGIDQRALAAHGLGTDLPMTGSWRSLNLDLALYMFLRPLGLTWDYRYEQLWITTVEDARTWKDHSGMSQLEPPDGSRWKTALDSTMVVEFIETRLPPQSCRCPFFPTRSDRDDLTSPPALGW